ncbi:MAG: ABC transporter ATP-binding protein [Spirochaetota bacterium]|nr:MAG: ABC transporter ATP-binding protein [Spirochaetota bacterium]
MMILSIRDLYVNYGKLEVLKGVSLEVEEGKISLLLGANGSGKSTMLKTISGLISPVGGSIWFEDRRIDKLPTVDRLRAGLAHMPEGKRLFTEMSVKENLLIGAYSRKDKKEIDKSIETMYELFPILRERQKERSDKMSGGEQQMLAFARALMIKPKLLLMDEPAQGLSPVLVSQVADTVTKIAKTGTTILIVEHNLRLGLSIADTVFVLENGKIAFQAKSTDLSQIEYAKKIYLGG